MRAWGLSHLPPPPPRMKAWGLSLSPQRTRAWGLSSPAPPPLRMRVWGLSRLPTPPPRMRAWGLSLRQDFGGERAQATSPGPLLCHAEAVVPQCAVVLWRLQEIVQDRTCSAHSRSSTDAAPNLTDEPGGLRPAPRPQCGRIC